MSTTVTTAGTQGGTRASVRDSSGIPYVVVESSGNIQLWKGNSSTPTTFSEVDASNAPNDSNYKAVSVAIKSDDTICVVFFDDDTAKGGGGCKYVEVSSDTWGSVETVGAVIDGSSREYTSISIDADDVPHVVYVDSDSNMGTNYTTVFYANKIGGSWNTTVEVEGFSNSNNCRTPEITIDADNEPIVVFSSITNEDVTIAQGNITNATAFTLHDITVSVFVTDQTTSICVDSNGDHHIAYLVETGGANSHDLYHAYHTKGDGWATWTTEVVDSGFNADSSGGVLPKGNIVASETDLYIFLEDDSSNDVVYYADTGSGWGSQQTLETGTFSNVKAKWAFWVDNDSGGAIKTQTGYHFDASDAGPSDPGGIWTNESNAFNGSVGTFASSTTIGSTSNDLRGEGTNAPASGDTIVAVLANCTVESTGSGYYLMTVYENGGTVSLGSINPNVSGGPTASAWFSLDVPSGGWTWAQVQGLEVRIYAYGAATEWRVHAMDILVLTESTAAELDYTFDDGSGIEFNTHTLAAVATTTERANPSSFRRPGAPGQF